MSLKDEIQRKIQDQVRQKVAQSQPKEKSFGDFMVNAKNDVVNFAKGIVYIGHKVATDPVESAKVAFDAAKVAVRETGKSVDDFAKEVGGVVSHPFETAKQLKSNVKKLRSISYEEQKQLMNKINTEIAEENKDGSPGERVLSAIAGGLATDLTQEITRPVEFAYEKPFTFGLDVLASGGGKVLGKTLKSVKATKAGAKTIGRVEELFVPNKRLINEGFGDFVTDFTKTKENIFNSQKRIIESTAKKFEKDLGLSKKERFEFFETIDSMRRDLTGTKATSNNQKVQNAINWWLDDQVPKIRKAAGLTEENTITNYLHHFFPEKVKGVKSTPLKVGDKGYLKKSEDVAGFSKDPIVSVSAIKSKLAVNALKDSFITRTFKKYGRNFDDLTNDLRNKIGLQEFNKLEESGKLFDRVKGEFGLDEFKFGDKSALLPRQIVDELNKFVLPKTQNALMTALDVFNRNWKPLATATRPRYHTRNVIGNLYNSIVIGGMNPKNIPSAAYQQIGNYFNELRKLNTTAGKLTNKIFPQFKGTKYVKMAIDDGVIGRGFFAMDLHDLAKATQQSDDIVKAIGKVKNPAEIYKVPVLRQYLQASFNIGEALENNARLALYIDRLKKGFSRARAKEYVNKHLFDYLTGLSETDKAIKKIIPFWSWTRFNIPLQVEGISMKPLRHTILNKGGQPIVAEVESKDDMLQFLSSEEIEAGLIKVGEIERNGKVFNKYVKTDSVLPVSDLARIVDILKLDPDDLGINPLVSLIYRLRSNRDYFGNLIESFSGEKKKFLNLALTGKQIEKVKLIPFLSELNKLVGGSYVEDEKPELNTRLEQVISPLGITIRDKEELEFFGLLEAEKELKGSYEAGLESLYKKYYQKSVTNKQEAVFKENVATLEKILKSKGLTDLNLLPLKIEAIKASIQEQIKDQIQQQVKESKSSSENQKNDINNTPEKR